MYNRELAQSSKRVTPTATAQTRMNGTDAYIRHWHNWMLANKRSVSCDLEFNWSGHGSVIWLYQGFLIMRGRCVKTSELRSNSTASPQFIEHRTQHTTFGDRSFSCYAPRLWNSLPDSIKSATSVETFKKLLKQHLFKIAYSQWLLFVMNLLCIYLLCFALYFCLCYCTGDAP